jgi:hypothetical protein
MPGTSKQVVNQAVTIRDEPSGFLRGLRVEISWRVLWLPDRCFDTELS